MEYASQYFITCETDDLICNGPLPGTAGASEVMP
jgi:hypothetical protein